MWIRTYKGGYVNSDKCTSFYVVDSHKGDGCVIQAKVENEERPFTIAEFNNREDARLYLDRMMKSTCVRIFEVDMAEWNYTGHKKDHKETRRGGS